MQELLFADLLARLYAAASQDEEWQLFVRSLEVQLGDAIALYVRLPTVGDPGSCLAATIDPGFLKAYEEHFFGLDPLLRGIQYRSRGLVEVASRPRGGDPDTCAFHRDWLVPQGLRTGRSLLALIEPCADGGPAALLTFPRGAGASMMRTKQRLVSRLMPHLQRAVHMHLRFRKIRLERDAFGATLDRLRMGLVLVGDHGIVVGKNHAAGGMLQLRDGLTDDGGVLRAWGARADAELHLACRRAAGGTSHGGVRLLSLPRPSGLTGLVIAVTSARNDGDATEPPTPVAAVFISDPVAMTGPSPEALGRFYGLTPAQAALACELVQGRSLEDAALRLGVTHETARTRLKQVFLRTDTHRQADLMRLVLTSPAQVLRDD